MLKTFICSFVAICLVLPVNGSDYFSYTAGINWEFDYGSYSGHSRGGTTDSGIVTWTVIKIEPQGSGKKITIRQKRTLRREIFLMAAYDKNYDSVFNPPREVSSGDITFIDSDNEATGTISLCNEQKTLVLIHDLNGKIPSGIAVQKTTSIILGSQRSVIALKNGFNYKQCENIGPVEFSDSVKIGMNGLDCENWKLHSLPVSTRNELQQIQKYQINNIRPQLTMRMHGFTNSTYGNNLLYDLRGRIATDINKSGQVSRCSGIFICLPGKKPENIQSIKLQH